MKRLVYAIRRNAPIDSRRGLSGVNGTEILHHTDGILAAAYSVISESSGVPGVSQFLAYAAIVEQLCQQGTILPMRYGCVMSTTEEISRLLQSNRQAFCERLDKVAGCLEIGVRILPRDMSRLEDEPPSRSNWSVGPAAATLTSRDEAPPKSGIAYLSMRKQQFLQKDCCKSAVDAAAQRIKAGLAGWFVGVAAEASTGANPWMQSLHFLVRRENTPRFIAAFQELDETGSARLLLTGPWPPYNFVH